MKALLWTLVVLGFTELIVTTYFGLIGKVPERSAAGMAWNAALVAVMAAWALWLVVRL